MTDNDLFRIKRMVNMRQLNLNAAGAEVSLARNKHAELEKAVRAAETKADESIKACRSKVGVTLSAEDLALDSGCVIAATEEVHEQSTLLHKSEKELDAKTEELKTAHTELKQMKHLMNGVKQDYERDTNKKDQIEIDDLAAIKEHL